MKRCLAALLVLVLLLSGSVMVYAQEEETTDTPSDQAEEITNADGPAGLTGIIDADYLQKTISEYVSQNGMESGESAVSIGYCYTATGDTWFYNGDAWYYSASLYKIPVTMLFEEEENAGKITQETMISNEYATGIVSDMEHKSIVYSDNNTGHAMVEYMGGSYAGKCSDQTIKYTDLPESYFDQSFFDYSYYSARYYTQILQYIYNNQDQFPHIIPYMKEATTYEQNADDLYFLSRDGRYEVAQKYGSYVEKSGEGDDNKHAGGIIYTPNPIIVTIMTKNVTHFDIKIGDLTSILVDYTLELDSKIEEYKVEQERLAKEAEEAAAQAEQQRIEQETAAKAEAERQAEEQRQAEELAKLRAEQAEKKSKATKTGIVIAVIAVLLVAGFIFIKKKFGDKFRVNSKYYYDDDDEYEDEYEDEDEDIRPFRPETKLAKTKKSGRREYSEEYEEYEEYEDEETEEEDEETEEYADEYYTEEEYKRPRSYDKNSKDYGGYIPKH